MSEQSFAEHAWHMAMQHERARFYSLDNATKWVWFAAVMSLDASAAGSDVWWHELTSVLSLSDSELERHVVTLVERGLLRNAGGVGDLGLPHELRLTPAHHSAKIVRQRPEPKVVAVRDS